MATTGAKIGAFTEVGEGVYSGNIRTLALDMEGIIIAAIQADAENPRAPNYRVFTNHGDIGAAWDKPASDAGPAYISVKLDDPSFPAPVNARLVHVSGDRWDLYWLRERPVASRASMTTP